HSKLVPHLSVSNPKWFLYQSFIFSGFLHLKKIPPMPVTFFIYPAFSYAVLIQSITSLSMSFMLVKFILCEHIAFGFSCSNFPLGSCPLRLIPISKRFFVAGFKVANCFFRLKLTYAFLGAISMSFPKLWISEMSLS